MLLIDVDCYAGYRGDQRPIRLRFGGNALEVINIEDQWYSPAAMYFRVLASDGNTYVLRHDEPQDQWSLDGFRSGS
jgi:hypothetical protein